MKKQLLSAATIILAIVLFVGYEFGYKATRAKNQEWEGQIAQKTRKRLWRKGFKKPLEGAQHRYYDHFWNVQCKDGTSIEIEVPYTLWNRSNVGDPVRKIKGDRWPFIDTPEATEQRRLSDQVIGDVIQSFGSDGADQNQAK
ncbi:MAG: hypothetical protein R6V12_18075 [Candidatus Hydrogenedentota bacterium]